MLVQVLEALPSNLQESIIHASPHPLPHILSVLPQHLHMVALSAAYPSMVASPSVLEVSPRDILATEQKVLSLWGLLGQLSSIQHLNIDVGHRYPSVSLPWPGPLPQLPDLTYLKIKGVALPSAGGGTAWNGWGIWHLTLLQRLELIQAGIEPEGMRVVAPQLMKLTSLEHLCLSHNALLTAGALALAPSLARLCGLKHPSVANVQAHSASVQVLVHCISGLTNLTYVDLAELPNVWDLHRRLSQMLVTMEKLQHLNLAQCSAEEHVLPVLTTLTDLRNLCLEGFLKDRGAIAVLSKHLAVMTRLTELNLRLNSIDDEHIDTLAPAIGNLTALRVLDFRENLDGSEGLKGILKHLSRVTSLQKLYIDGDTIEEGAVCALVKYLGTLSDLQCFAVDWECGFRGSKMLVESLGDITTLLQLELYLDTLYCSNDQHSLPLCEALAHSLTSLKRLQALQLAPNFCHYSGVRLLAPAIGHMTALTSLALADTEIELLDTGLDDSGLGALCPCISGLTNLQVLKLQAPHIGCASCDALFVCLGQLRVLRYLHMYTYELSADILQGLLGCVARHGALHFIEVNIECSNMASVLKQYPDAARLLVFRTFH